MTAEEKYRELLKHLKGLGKLAVAFSGGVDSTFLVHAAREALGRKVLALTVNTDYIPDWEVSEAATWVKKAKIKHVVINVETPESIRENPKDRCYFCKQQLFGILLAEAEKRGYRKLAEGTNKDDEGHYRPGMKAIDELGILSPLREVGMTKGEIRELSKKFALPTWNKPAYACLLTRIPYDTQITREELQRIEEGELFLFNAGFEGARLRSHGELARIELQPGQFDRLQDQDLRNKVAEGIRKAGYRHVCVDLEWYRMGSFDGVYTEPSRSTQDDKIN